MRLLALHGYASNGATFTTVKSKALATKSSAAGITFSPLDGGVAIQGARHGTQRAWFLFDPPYPLSDRTQQPVWRQHEFVEFIGAEEAIDALVEEWSGGEFGGVIERWRSSSSSCRRATPRTTRSTPSALRRRQRSTCLLKLLPPLSLHVLQIQVVSSERMRYSWMIFA